MKNTTSSGQPATYSLNNASDKANKANKANKVIPEEMADDYAAFLLDLWHSGQKVNKINEKGEVSMGEE